MVTALLFGLVGLLDATAAMYRRDAGRNARVLKRNFLLASARRGFVAGVLGDAIALCWIALSSSSNRHDLEVAGQAAMWISAPMVVAFAVATCMRATRNLEIKTLASAVIFGPLTFVRPYAMMLAAVVAFVVRPTAYVGATIVLFVFLIVWWTRFPWPAINAGAIRKHEQWKQVK